MGTSIEKLVVPRFENTFMKALLKLTVFLGLSNSLFGQGITAPDEVISAALQNHPLAKAAAFNVQAKKHGEKSAVNIPNPEINTESPTGDFYTIGITQTFEFPTVYARQKQAAKTETSLEKTGQLVQANDLRYQVRALYLEAQLAVFQAQQWVQRDSFYQAMATSANRQFSAGEIDFLQKTLLENEAGKVRLERLGMDLKVAAARQQLVTFTGLNDLGNLAPLLADTAGLNAAQSLADNPSLRFQQQSVQRAAQQIDLAKSRALPNFSLGYLNQAAQNSPIDYRFRASIGVPLWAGQYQGEIKAAQAERSAAQARSEAESQSLAMQQQRSRVEALMALAQVQFYENEALPRSRALISAAMRMQEAGQIDYIATLRILDEAYAIQREYGDQLHAFNAARIQMQYLAGQ